MAATFVDLASGRAVRIVALEDSRELARKLYPHEENKSRRQMLAYRELPDAQLFREQWVRVAIDPADLPGQSDERVICPRCGEGVNFGRFRSLVNGERLSLPLLRQSRASLLGADSAGRLITRLCRASRRRSPMRRSDHRGVLRATNSKAPRP